MLTDRTLIEGVGLSRQLVGEEAFGAHGYQYSGNILIGTPEDDDRHLPRDEAFAIPDLIRTKINLLPEGISEVRTVEIVGLDLQADGGTHVANLNNGQKLPVSRLQSRILRERLLKL